MCFSLEVSAVASGVLLAAGTVGVIKARKSSVRYFAAIPLFFGIQQGIEALQWMVEKPSIESTILGYGFLFFAFILWPFYTPFSVFMMEQHEKRKKLLKYLTYIGALESLFLFMACLLFPLSVYVVERHIVYDIYVPLISISLPLYVLAVSTSVLSTRPYARLLGITTFVGFITSVLVYWYAFTSVWCFFAAILSVVVLAEVFKRK